MWPELATQPLEARTVYLGGGTPSLLSSTQIEAILHAIRDRFWTRSDMEVTIEANPGTVDQSYMERLLRLGVNRLSLGFETLDDRMLRLFRRGHTSRDSFGAFHMARAAGFDNVNIDLMYALPGQTLEDWRKDLEQVIALQPEHVSAYQLSLHENTVLFKQVARGLVRLPDDELSAEMYLMACEMLGAAGYEHYEIASWARKRCQHNLIYWRREPYLGFGAGAHSFAKNVRYWNAMHPAEYIRRVMTTGLAVVGSERVEGDLALSEKAMLALRLRDGLSEAELVHASSGQQSRIRESLEAFRSLALAERGGDRWSLTERGWLVANDLFVRLLP